MRELHALVKWQPKEMVHDLRVLGPLLTLLVGSFVQAERQRPQYEAQYHEVSLAYETPHTKWAKPYAGGPVRALFIGPRGVMREVAELAQRLSLEYEEVIVHTRHQLGGDASTGYQAIIGGLPEDITERLNEKLRRQYDVVIVGNVQWRILPEQIEYEILRKTRDGCGLVLSLVDGETDHLKQFLERAKPESGMDFVASGVPFAGLDVWKAFGVGAEAADKVVELRRFGRGRVARLKIGSASAWTLLTPPVSDAADRPWLWDYYLSLPIRAILWAAQRAPSARLASLQLLGSDGNPTTAPPRAALGQSRLAVSWREAGTVKKPSVSFRLRGPDGETIAQQEKTVTPKDGSASLDWPLVPLVQRQHFADVWLKDGDTIIDWASLSFTPQGPNSIKGLSLAKESIGPHESCGVGVTLAAPATEKLTVGLSGFDPYGRLLAEATAQLSKGDAETKGALPTRNLIANALHVRASLRLGDQELDRAWIWQPVANPYPHDEFGFLVWAGPGDEFIPYYVGKVLADAGVDTINHGWGLALARHALRGTPGVRAGLHFNECKVENHVRTPCFNDPAHRQVVRDRLLGAARDHVRFGATAYTLGDDNQLAPVDVCFSEFCKADFRRYLKEVYGSLDALNAEWETASAAWEEVVPALLEDVQKTDRVAQWADHRMHMESVWANFHKFALDTVREVDRTARVGSDAACGRGSFGGYDWWKLSRILSLWNVYPDPIQVEALRTFHQPGAYTGIWYGGYLGGRYEANERWAPWYSVFHQLSAAWWFQSFPSSGEVCQELAIASDLTPFKPFVTTSEEIAEIKRGIGKLLLTAKRNHDGVAMLFSQASVHASTIDGSFGQAEEARRAWVELLEDVGLQYDFVAYEEVEQGALLKRGYRVLVLPACFALSDKEVAAVDAFVQAGGNVIADVRPGLRDGHCKPTDTPARRALFGVSFDKLRMTSTAGGSEKAQPITAAGTLTVGRQTIPYELKNVVADLGVKLEPGTTQAREIGSKPTAPHLLMHERGKGHVLLLNFPIDSYVKAKSETEWLRQLIGPTMRALSAKPLAEITAAKGEPFDVEQVSFTDGSARYLGLTRWHWADKPTQTFTVTLAGKFHVYDARTGKYVGERERFEVELGQGKSALFSLLPYRVTGCKLSAAKSVRRGQLLTTSVGFEAKGPRARHVVHVEVSDPKGAALQHYAQNVVVPADSPSVGSVAVPTALNDPGGTWRIEARDVATGANASASVEVR